MSISKWDRIVTKAWLERNDSQSRWWHPAKASLIYARYYKNIDRAERYLTAERMVERYADTAYRRASDHACSYPSNSWKYQYWIDVCDYIKQIEKAQELEAKKAVTRFVMNTKIEEV